MQITNDEEALNQLHDDNGYNAHDRQLYRSLRFWLDLSPQQALQRFLQESAEDARKIEDEE